MDEKYWKQFETSGKIEDYLNFAAMRSADAVGGYADAVRHRENTIEMVNARIDGSGSTTEGFGETGQSCRNIFM